MTGTRGRRFRGRLAGPVVAGVLLLGLAAGCSSRSSLGTSDSSCYLALPAATQAVHSHGRLIGVRSLTLGSLHEQAPHLMSELGAGHARSQRVCVVAFVGHFDRSSVTDPSGRTAGRLAVVVTTAPGNDLLGTVIFARAPLRFGHTHFA